MENEKKKLRDTKVGQWLTKNAPKVLDTVGDLLPENGALGVVKNLIDNDPDLTHEQRMEFRQLDLELQIEEQRSVTERWKADMASDVKLAKYIRPVVLITLLALYAGLVVVDSIGTVQFDVKESYVDLLQVLMLTAFGAYFAGRSLEKARRV